MMKPLLVLINGPAAGAGLSLALSGDIVLARKAAHFTAAYGQLGLTPDGGMSWMLPRLVGLRKAQEIIFTNRRIDAQEAEAIGLVTRVVDHDQLDAEGQTIARQLAEGATAALGIARGLLRDSFQTGFEAQMEAEAQAIAVAVASPHGREGVSAFLEKRLPVFDRQRASVSQGKDRLES